NPAVAPALKQLTFDQYDDSGLHSQATRGSSEALVFSDSDDATIHGGYHLTELKAASFDTVDCGAQKNQWNETIVQLWVPEDEENGEFMTAQKFWQSTTRSRG